MSTSIDSRPVMPRFVARLLPTVADVVSCSERSVHSLHQRSAQCDDVAAARGVLVGGRHGRQRRVGNRLQVPET